MKIRTKLTLGFVGIASLVAGVGYLSVATSQKALQESIGKRTTALAGEILKRVDNVIYSRIEQLEVYTKDIEKEPMFIQSNQTFDAQDNIEEYIDRMDRAWQAAAPEQITEFMADLIHNELSEEIRDELILSEFYEEKYGCEIFSEVFVTNKYGVNVAQSQKTSDYYQGDEHWWQKARDDGLYVGDVAYDKSAKVYSVDICVRIEDEDKNFLGVLKAVCNIKGIVDIIPTAKTEANIAELEQKTIQFKLLTRDLKIIYATEDYEFLEPLPPDYLSSVQTQHDLHRACGYFIMAGDMPGEEEELIVHVHSLGYKQYPGLGWILLAELATKEIFTPVIQLRNRILIISLAVSAVAVFLGFFLSKTIAHPISKLALAVTKIGTGDLNIRAEIQSHDEVGQLAASFNAMAEDLQKTTTSIDNLENEISERKQVEEKLRRLAMIAEQAYEGIAFADLEGVIQFANQAWAQMHGYKTTEELIGKNFTLFHTEEQIQTEVIPFNEEVLKTGVNKGEMGHVRKDGTIFPTEMKVSLFRTDQSEPIGFIAFATDITERKEAETRLKQAKEEAERANQAKSQFLANMSHEIRTPMNAILGFSDILAQEELTNEQRDYVNTIRNSGNNLLTIINDILDFSKIESGNMDLELIECSLEGILCNVGSLLRPKATEKGLDFQILHRTALPATILTDPTRLGQCLINLAGNAIKFTESGHVHIMVSLQGVNERPMIYFDVEDTGVGIPAPKQRAIFQSFTQADGSTTRNFGGTGLGLTITKQLAELMGGGVFVTSKPGAGSVFTLVIPAGVNVKEQLKLGEEQMKDYTELEKPTRKETYCGQILIAEDAPANQKLIMALLHKAGLEPVLVENGTQAVEAATEHAFDLIFMDMQMPIMNGYEATHILRRQGLTTPIIALTAHAMKGDEKKCVDAGCDGYLSKPLDRQELHEVLAKYLTPLSAESNITAQNDSSPSGQDTSTETNPTPIDTTKSIVDWHALSAVCDDEEVISEITASICEDAPASMEKILTAVRERDFANLEMYAHRMKGSMATFGAKTVAACAAQLEQAGKDEDIKSAQAMIEQIQTQVNSLLSFLTDPDWFQKLKEQSGTTQE